VGVGRAFQFIELCAMAAALDLEKSALKKFNYLLYPCFCSIFNSI